VLGDFKIRAYDDEEIARLAKLGFTPETDPTVMVDGPGFALCFQKIVSVKSPRNRIHFDIVGAVRAEEVNRIIALGGAVRDEHDNHTVMLDPEGNQFCVQDPR
jgi:hypothetical protein